MKTTMDIKILAIMLVLGIPAIGLYLYAMATEMADQNLLYIATFLVLMFPIVISANILRSKSV